MINIDEAIKISQSKKNISNGGSACFDFVDVVLVRYSCPLKYLNDGSRIRENSEDIMASINQKREAGVNTPKHLDVKRIVEGKEDVCYVLQEKCPGINCESLFEHGVPFSRARYDLAYIMGIPFEHYTKLISDGLELFEMGFEAKNKNLFYDDKTGFWYIDFLTNEKDYQFDASDVFKIFEAIKYRVPRPVNIGSTLMYGEELSQSQREILQALQYGIKAKTLQATKTVLPEFAKYEKFYLLPEEDEYKKYLNDSHLVMKNLSVIEENDYEIYQELYEIVMQKIIDKIVTGKCKFWDIECNYIRIYSDVFNLRDFFAQSKYNTISVEEFDDDYDYRLTVEKLYNILFIEDLVNRLKRLPQEDHVSNFIIEAEEYFRSEKGRVR